MSTVAGWTANSHSAITTMLIAVFLVSVPSSVAIAEPTDAAHTLYQSGLQCKKSGDMVGALRDLNAAIDESPDFADAYWVRGWVQADIEDNEGACLSFNRFLGLTPDDPRAEQAREAIGRLGGDVSPSVDGPATEPQLEMQLTSEQAQKLVLEAEQAFYGGDYTMAADKAEKAVDAFPDKERLLYTLVLSYASLERWQEAFETTEELLVLTCKSSFDLLYSGHYGNSGDTGPPVRA